MSKSRKIFLWSVLGAIVFGHAFTFLIGRHDLWPFSSYTMYSKPAHIEYAEIYLPVGVLADGSEQEIELSRNWDYIRPLYRGLLNNSIQRFDVDDTSELRLKEAAKDILKRYEARRKKGLHDGPPLAAVRLYQYFWHYDRLEGDSDDPTERRLLIESRLDEGASK